MLAGTGGWEKKLLFIVLYESRSVIDVFWSSPVLSLRSARQGYIALAAPTGLVQPALSGVGKGPKQGRAETSLASLRRQVSVTPPSSQHDRLDVDVQGLFTGVTMTIEGRWPFGSASFYAIILEPSSLQTELGDVVRATGDVIHYRSKGILNA